MKLSHNFCIEINKYTLSQLYKGKGQKFVLYIHWFWKKKTKKNLNVTTPCVYSYRIQFLGFLLVRNF